MPTFVQLLPNSWIMADRVGDGVNDKKGASCMMRQSLARVWKEGMRESYICVYVCVLYSLTLSWYNFLCNMIRMNSMRHWVECALPIPADVCSVGIFPFQELSTQLSNLQDNRKSSTPVPSKVIPDIITACLYRLCYIHHNGRPVASIVWQMADGREVEWQHNDERVSGENDVWCNSVRVYNEWCILGILAHLYNLFPLCSLTRPKKMCGNKAACLR